MLKTSITIVYYIVYSIFECWFIYIYLSISSNIVIWLYIAQKKVRTYTWIRSSLNSKPNFRIFFHQYTPNNIRHFYSLFSNLNHLWKINALAHYLFSSMSMSGKELITADNYTLWAKSTVTVFLKFTLNSPKAKYYSFWLYDTYFALIWELAIVLSSAYSISIAMQSRVYKHNYQTRDVECSSRNPW